MTGFEPYDPNKPDAYKRRTDTIEKVNSPKPSLLGQFKTIFPFLIIAAALGFAYYDWKYDEFSGTPVPGITFAIFVFAIWWFFLRGKKRV